MFENVTNLFKTKKSYEDLFEKYELEFSNKTLTNGIWLLGDDKEQNLKEKTLEKTLEYLIQKDYGVIYISTGENEYIKKIDDIVTKKRHSRNHHPVAGDMASINSLNFPKELQNTKIVEIDLTKYDKEDEAIVLERLNLQFKKLFHDMYTNFKAYPKKEGLRSVIIIDEYDPKKFKAFTNIEFFQTMKDYDIGFIFGVERDFFEKKLNPHKEQLKQIVRFNILEC